MGELLELSARVIDSGVADEPVNRVTEELSELGDDLAIVGSFSHCVVLRTDEGLVAFDARAEIYRQRRTTERSLMSKGIHAAATRESEEVVRRAGRST